VVAAAGLLQFAGIAHAQPTSWTSHELGTMTYYTGTDAQGGQWTDTSYKQGATIYNDFSGPNGERYHCGSWQVGSRTFADCR
jgi:hypothetical protein